MISHYILLQNKHLMFEKVRRFQTQKKFATNESDGRIVEYGGVITENSQFSQKLAPALPQESFIYESKRWLNVWKSDKFSERNHFM